MISDKMANGASSNIIKSISVNSQGNFLMHFIWVLFLSDRRAEEKDIGLKEEVERNFCGFFHRIMKFVAAGK